MVGDCAASLGGTGSPRNIVGCLGPVDYGRGTEESGRRLGTRERVVQVGLMGIGIGDS